MNHKTQIKIAIMDIIARDAMTTVFDLIHEFSTGSTHPLINSTSGIKLQVTKSAIRSALIDLVADGRIRVKKQSKGFIYLPNNL